MWLFFSYQNWTLFFLSNPKLHWKVSNKNLLSKNYTVEYFSSLLKCDFFIFSFPWSAHQLCFGERKVSLQQPAILTSFKLTTQWNFGSHKTDSGFRRLNSVIIFIVIPNTLTESDTREWHIRAHPCPLDVPNTTFSLLRQQTQHVIPLFF